ncbi:MAG: hypothetical protein ACPG6V_09685 [Flavobacteriales bacterium]
MNLNELSSNQILLLSKEDLMEALQQFALELEKQKIVHKPWISVDEAKNMLSIKSSTTLFKLKNEGKISFAQPSRKILLFERQSILDFLENNKQNTF